MRTRFLQLLKPDDRVQPGMYSGYFLWTIIVVVAISLIGLASGSATLFDAILQTLIFGAMALSYDYFSGYSGHYNLGFGAFLAVGGYVFVALSNGGLDIFLSLILAGVSAAVFAGVISYPFLRLKGGYFAVGTLALVILLFIFDINLYAYTGGSIGFHVNAATPAISLPLFIGSTVFLILNLGMHLTIGRSQLGLALRSIREEEEVTDSLGVNTFRVKQIALVLSGFFAGISGGMYAIYLGFVNATNLLGLSTGLFPVTAAIVGGTGIFIGPLAGVFILSGLNLALPPIISQVNPSLTVSPLVFIGILLIVAGVFFPTGLLRIRFLKKISDVSADKFVWRWDAKNKKRMHPVLSS